MRLNQIVQWTLLPAGLTPDGHFAASVFIAPRLRPEAGGTLGDFPDFADWPSIVASATVTLQREDGSTEMPMHTLVQADGDLWRALFPPETPVRPFVFDDYADRPIISYPFLGVLDHLKERWSFLAAEAIEELPLSSRSASPIGPAIDMETPGPILADHFRSLRSVFRTGLFEGIRSEEELSHRMRDRLRDVAAQAAELRRMHSLSPRPLLRPFELAGNSVRDLYSLSMFHRRPLREPPRFPADQEEAEAELAAQSEFHGLISSLGDHPTLMRRLGLVIDLVIRPGFVPERTDSDAPGRLRVLIDRRSAFPSRGDSAAETWNIDVLPWTLARFSTVGESAYFSAAERNPGVRRFAHGFLRLDPPGFEAVAVDVDGLALKALNMAATLNWQEEQIARPVDEPAEDGAPMPRTGGLALVHRGHAEELHRDFYAARANDDTLEKLDPNNAPVLADEDLVRGFRMDVFDGRTGTWRSLHERRASYTPLRVPEAQIEVEDEGTMQVSLTGEIERPDSPANPDGAVYAHEALLTWNGWSLAAARPEQAIAQEPPVPAAGAELGPLRLDTIIVVRQGSLPRLRFGERYKVRIRTVDLAGNAHSMDAADRITQAFEAAGDPDYTVSTPADTMVYRRFEPVPPPELVARRRFGPGEGLERLVIRSNFDQTAEDYAISSQSAGNEMFRYVPFCDRHVAPPKTSLQMAELHGKFDDAFNSVQGLSVEEAAAATASFYDAAARENGSFLDLPGAISVPPGYPVVDADEVGLPYLPDPLCHGAILLIQLEPDQPLAEHIVGFVEGRDWVELNPFRLRLAAAATPTAWQSGPSLFVVGLPPGRTARLKLNCLTHDPEVFGILDWCRAKLSQADADRVYEGIKASRHWMTTPWRTIELIHAVQQPLEPPEMHITLEKPSVFGRQRGQSAAALKGEVMLDIPSTGRIDLVAQWEDFVDDTIGPLEHTDNLVRRRRSTVFSFALPEPFGTPWSSEISPVLSRVDERMVRFATEMPEESIEDLRHRLLEDSLLAPTVQERNRLSAAASHIEQVRPHEFGDTAYRRVSYHMIASTRFREYFDPDLPVEKGQRLGNVQTVEMLNSAPPPIPEIIDVVPLLRWEEEGNLATGLTSTRYGIGLRVWLARPWFATGAGEMLGIICRDDGMVVPSMATFREITYIARDPLHAGTIPMPLDRSSFEGAATSIDEIQVTTQSGRANVSLVAFEPKYDRLQDAWYCDLRFDTGTAYFPFVRLGLVRYQPRSIPGCETSRVSPTYFIQPLPDRAMTVVGSSEGALRVTLRGPAPMGRVGPTGAVTGTNVAVAMIEEQDPRIADPSLGWTAIGTEVVLAATVDDGGVATWSGEVPVPQGGAQRRRLSVREYELHMADDRTSAFGDQVETRRLVHADYILL